MCAIAKVGKNTVRPGDDLLIGYNGGTDYRRWGFEGLYNARMEGLTTFWKRYEKVYVYLDGFYEGGKLFELRTGLPMSIAGVSDGSNVFIVTRNSVDLVKPFHGRMPVILSKPQEYVERNSIIEIDYDLLKIA